MSNQNLWKLAGGIGISPNPIAAGQQVMTQGIGFPLRPVDNVPQESAPIYPEGLVAEGLFMQWMPNGYEEGKYYAKGSTLALGEFTLVANRLNLDYPAPVPNGSPSFGIPSYAPATQSNTSSVNSGNVYTFTEDGWAKKLRVWVTEITANTSYRIVMVNETDPQNPITSIIENPVLVENGWQNIALLNDIVLSGTVLRVFIDALNSGAETQVTGGWDNYGTSQSGAPPLQGWNRDNQHTIVRVDKTDLDGTDRSSELLGVIPDSILTISQTDTPTRSYQYRIINTNDLVDYVLYSVVLLSVGEDGPNVGTTTLTFDIPIALPTQYAEEAATVPTPTWAAVEGFLAFDGVDQGGAANTYGVDIEFEPAVVSDAWDILSISVV